MSLIAATDADFSTQLADSPKVVVKYFADWCGSCRMIAPKFKRLAEDERFEGVTFLEVNAEESPEARKAAGVNNLPFFATFKDGQLVEGAAISKMERVEEMITDLG